MQFQSKYSNFIQENAFENAVCKVSSILSRPQFVKDKLLFNELDTYHYVLAIKLNKISHILDWEQNIPFITTNSVFIPHATPQ